MTDFRTANASFADGQQFAWDSTSIKLANECLKKYEYRMILGWRPLHESVHLRFGGVYAKALETYHKLRAEEVDREEAIVRVVSLALYMTWDYETCETCEGEGTGMVMRCEGGQPYESPGDCPDCDGRGTYGGTPWTSDHSAKTRENLIRTIVWYLEQFADDSCSTIILSDGSAAVEHSFRLPVDNGIVLAGHLDRLVDYAGKPYIQDQKTTGSTITARFFAGYNPDDQISGMYPFAGRSIFGLPIKGVMLDGAQIAVGFSRFERGFIFVDDGQLNEWYDDAMYTIERARTATAEGHFPRNRGSCHKFAGCEFREICSKSPHVREQFLKGSFEQRPTWDPLEVR
jgi:hypothetical protein